MEAAARGAKQAGGRTIGVSVGFYRPENRNTWLDQEIVAESLFARLEKLVTLGDAFVVLRGGIGTMLELALVWNLVQSIEFSGKPVVVVGTAWSTVIDVLRERLPMHSWESDSLVTVESVEDAVGQLQLHFDAGASGPARSAYPS
jgi:predicted Rossmann-fold nucleotide-binding protein